jgi:2-hydroxy-3-oxopropionate reductase
VRQALMGGLATSRILGTARRADDQAELRPGLPHRAAPEGPEPGAPGREALGLSLPNTATCQELFNACAARGGSAWDHSAMVRALELLGNHEIGAKSG